MRDYVIFSDSTSDLPAQLAAEIQVEVLPLSLTIGDDIYKNYLDEREISNQEFYRRLVANETVSTSQISPGEFMENFRPVLQQGKGVIYIALSSGISATYSSSLLAREQLLEEFPDAQIYCVDSLGASMGEGLLVWHAAQRKAEGYSIELLYQWLLDNRLSICHWFTVDDLMHLYRHGRCTGAAMFAGSLLSIKPVLHVDNEGKLIPVEKVRNTKKAQAALVEKMASTVSEPEGHMVFISHADNLEGAHYVEKLIRERWAVKDVVISYIGPVVGSHAGRGCVALFFTGAPR